MSKKKHRKHRRGPVPLNPKAINGHHLCWQRRYWKKGAIKELREFHYCVVQIPKNTLHKYIHEKMNLIPVPKEENARFALEQLEYLYSINAIRNDDTLDKRLNLLAALFDCVDQPTADAFRKQLSIIHDFYEEPP